MTKCIILKYCKVLEKLGISDIKKQHSKKTIADANSTLTEERGDSAKLREWTEVLLTQYSGLSSALCLQAGPTQLLSCSVSELEDTATRGFRFP